MEPERWLPWGDEDSMDTNLSNLTYMPSFGEQAIISCARIQHIREDFSEPSIKTARRATSGLRRSGEAVREGVRDDPRGHRATCLSRRSAGGDVSRIAGCCAGLWALHLRG